MSRTQLRLGQVTGSFGAGAGKISQGETKSSISAMTVNDLSDVLGHMASAIKRIHGATDFSDQDAGNFSLALTGSAGMKLAGDLDVDSSADIAGAVNMQAGLTVAGVTALNGNVDLGDATTDSVTFVAKVDSDILPDGTRDLGAAGLAWAEVHSDAYYGTGSLSSLAVADLTDNRVLIAGTSGEIEDDGNFTFDGTTLTLAGARDLSVGRDATVGRNLTVTGDFTVNGTTTTLDTANLAVEDAVILLGSGSTGAAAAGDRGLLMEIGSETNPAMFWDESEDQFAFVRTNASATDNTITADAYADLRVQELTASNGINAPGQSLFASVAVGDLTSGRVVLAGVGGELSDDSGLTFIPADDKLVVVGDVQGAAISGSATNAFQMNGSGNQQIVKTTAGNFGFKTAGPNAQLGFADSHFTGSSHAGAQLPLATDVSEYNSFVTNFGNASIIDAINQARSGTPGAGKYTATAAADVSAGNSVAVGSFDRSVMTPAQLASQSDVYVNGQLLLSGAASGANARDYYFDGAGVDAVKFTFTIERDDAIAIVIR